MKQNKPQEITEIQLATLSLFTNGFNRTYYIREVQKILKISSRTALIALNQLEGKGILESQTRGRTILYRLRKLNITKDYLSMAEIYKKILFLAKMPLINEIVGKIMPNIEGIGVIFGSYAKGLERKNSDFDVFVIGSYNDEEIDNISRMYQIKVNIKCYPLNVFRRSINNDILIKEMLDNHIIFKNIEQFIGLAEVIYGKS